jgi:hypothetical protein
MKEEVCGFLSRKYRGLCPVDAGVCVPTNTGVCVPSNTGVCVLTDPF